MPDILDIAKGKPTCLSIVLCNEVLEDKRTNNKTLVSLFNRIDANELPLVYPRLFIMATLDDGVGTWIIEFRITAPSGTEVFYWQFTHVFTDPLRVEDVVLEQKRDNRAASLTEESRLAFQRQIAIFFGYNPPKLADVPV